ncbi:hypothetical protein [Alcaligenes sp. Marseille-Q7550]
MTDTDNTLRQFGETAGIADLSFDSRGQVVFRTGQGRLLGLEHAGPNILVYIASPIRYEAGAWLLKACKRAHHTHLEDWPIQAALRDYDGTPYLLALVCMRESEFTERRLLAALHHLSHWLDALHNES